MEKENTALKERLAGMVHKMKAMGQEHRSQLEHTSERQTSLEAIIKRQQSEITHSVTAFLRERNSIIFLYLWTKVGDVLFDETKYDIPYNIAQKHFRGELTDEEFINAVFEPQEQMSEIQAQLLGAAFMLASADPAQAQVGTDVSGSRLDIPWGKKKVKR